MMTGVVVVVLLMMMAKQSNSPTRNVICTSVGNTAVFQFQFLQSAAQSLGHSTLMATTSELTTTSEVHTAAQLLTDLSFVINESPNC